jgi:hypothetical protein
MPLRQYFVWVGSILLVMLFAADWCFPAPLPMHHILKFRRMRGSTSGSIRTLNGLKEWYSTPRVRE